jgi:hypothetical protein
MNDTNFKSNHPDLIKDLDPNNLLTQTGEDEYLRNYAALAQLKIEYDRWQKVLVTAGVIAVDALSITVPGSQVLSLSELGLDLASLEFIARLDRLYLVTKMLLDHFGDEGIIITPRVKTSEGTIDLFIKMPDRRSFALMLRSSGEKLVKWREDKQAFFVRSKKKTGSKEWISARKCLDQLDKASRLLRKEKSPVLGKSSDDRNSFITKTIVLTSKTQIDPNTDPACFRTFGRVTNVLSIKSVVRACVVESKDLIDFISLPDPELIK